jgi:hypothetical protein
MTGSAMIWRWLVKTLGPAAYWIAALITGGIEAIFVKSIHKRWGKHLIQTARKTVHDTEALDKWYLQYGYLYKKDEFNCYSRPYVTASRWRGDCEDFALLSREILKGYKRCVLAMCHGWREGKRRGHAVLLVYEEGRWRVMSNMYRMDSYETMEKAAESTYGEKTIDYFFVT